MSRPPVLPVSAVPRVVSFSLAAVAAFGLACGGGGDEPMPTAYAQADLAGTWDQVALHVGTSPAWLRRTVSIDAQGVVSVLAAESEGTTTTPMGRIVLRTDGAGSLVQTTAGTTDPFHGTIAKDRTLFAAVATPTSGTQALIVSRKRDGAVTYSDADIQGKPFVYHSLGAGKDGWRHGTGSFDASGLASVASFSAPNSITPGAAPLDGRTFSVEPDGFVTDGAQLRGFLTSDKSAIFFVHTDGTTFTLTAVELERTSGAFAQADLAGTFAFQSVATQGTGAIWHHGTVHIGTGGLASYTSYHDSAGGPTPNPFTLLLAADGTLTNPLSPTYHGTLAIGGDLYVRTQTHASGLFGVSLALRR